MQNKIKPRSHPILAVLMFVAFLALSILKSAPWSPRGRGVLERNLASRLENVESSETSNSLEKAYGIENSMVEITYVEQCPPFQDSKNSKMLKTLYSCNTCLLATVSKMSILSMNCPKRMQCCSTSVIFSEHPCAKMQKTQISCKTITLCMKF